MEKTIDLLRVKPARYGVADVSRQLDNLFDHLQSDLSSLLQGIESTIPTAVRASDLGGQVMFALGTEHARLNKAREDMPLWRRLKDINSFAGRQLSRDLRLTGDSVDSLKNTRRSLEEARGFLIGYRDQGQSLPSLFNSEADSFYSSLILQGVNDRLSYSRPRPGCGGRSLYPTRYHAEIPTICR